MDAPLARGGAGGNQFAPRTAWSRLRGDGGGGGGEGKAGEEEVVETGHGQQQRQRRHEPPPPPPPPPPPITVFMGVPTMYVMMLRTLEGMRRSRPEVAAASAAAAAALRLTVSGSAACPVPVMREWQSRQFTPERIRSNARLNRGVNARFITGGVHEKTEELRRLKRCV